LFVLFSGTSLFLRLVYSVQPENDAIDAQLEIAQKYLIL